MDLGLSGTTALVAASTQGLGYACAAALAREGTTVVLNGRTTARLDVAADRLRAQHPRAEVRTIAADLDDARSRAALVQQLPEVDILITNNAGPAPSGLEDWAPAAVHAAVEAATVAPLELIRAYLPGMRSRSFGRIVNITSAMVKAPLYELGLSAGARTALTALSKAISREVARDNVTINNLLPERIDSPRQHAMIARRAARLGVDYAEAERDTVRTVAAGRLGRPEEVGDACAFLCSRQAGFISGQNLQLDGGTYGGLL